MINAYVQQTKYRGFLLLLNVYSTEDKFIKAFKILCFLKSIKIIKHKISFNINFIIHSTSSVQNFVNNSNKPDRLEN